MEIEIYPYKISQRTKYSKFKVYNLIENKDISDSSQDLVEKILSDYNKQKENPDKYFHIKNKSLECTSLDVEDDDIEYLFVPDGIEHITYEAFARRTFKLINLPDTVKSIGGAAFIRCTELEYIKIPEQVKEINSHTFSECISLKNIVLPKDIGKELERQCFILCKSLKSIDIPDSVKFIGEDAFCGCESLESVKLPKNLFSLGYSAFESCESLKKITLPDKLERIEDNCFCKCSSLKELTIPDSVRSISESAFCECENLEYIKLSSNINSIQDGLFGSCKSLKELILPDNVKNLGECVLYGTELLKNINIPKELENIYHSPFSGSFLESLTFNYDFDNIKKFRSDLLAGSHIHKLIISNNVNKIETDMFCQNGKQITTIDYQGTKEEFEKFKKNNKNFFLTFSNIKEINFEKNVEKDNIINKEER